jgi:hypothetical protein
MRAIQRARWASCAVALMICLPAIADEHKKSVGDCAAFDQADQGDDAVAFTIKNACSMPLDCTIAWRVVCAPSSKKRRAVHATSAKLALIDGTSQTKEASASVCGDDDWTIDSVDWSCEPNKD